MRVKLAEWASIAEILSGIAVVVTLILLLLGIRENTDVTRASMYTSSVQELNALGRTLMADPVLTQLNEDFGEVHASELSEIEVNRLVQIIQTRFRNYDIAYSMFRYELFGENEWQRYEPLVCGSYRDAIASGINDRVLPVVSPGFLALMQDECTD